MLTVYLRLYRILKKGLDIFKAACVILAQVQKADDMLRNAYGMIVSVLVHMVLVALVVARLDNESFNISWWLVFIPVWVGALVSCSYSFIKFWYRTITKSSDWYRISYWSFGFDNNERSGRVLWCEVDYQIGTSSSNSEVQARG